MKKIIILLLIATIFAACQTRKVETIPESGQMMMGRGMGSSMGQRHHSRAPEPYTRIFNPVPESEDSLAKGEEIYAVNCATCHGDGGMGDGPGGKNLDPLPAPIAHTSQMMADAYLFWRISEGGTPFGTAMIPYADILDEQACWDVINYVRALGSGFVRSRQSMGGEVYSPGFIATQQAEMLALGVNQGVISEDEADIFERVHTDLEAFLATNLDGVINLTMDERQDTALSSLVSAGKIAQNEASVFKIIHDCLEENGLML